MRYRLTEDEQVKARASRIFVRDRARYEDIKKILSEHPYTTANDERRRKLEFDDGLAIYSYGMPSYRYRVIYTVREPDAGEARGAVRVVALIDREAERDVR